MYNVRDIWNTLFDDNVTENDNERTICCPFHNDNNPSFNIDLERGLWFCFGCHKGGNIYQLVKDFFGYNREQAKNYLKTYISQNILENNYSLNEKQKEKQLNEYLNKNKKESWDFSLPNDFKLIEESYYLEKVRGLTKEEIKRDKWGISKEYKNRVILPIYMKDKLYTYFARDITGKSKIKSKNAKNGKAKECLYGWNDIKNYDSVILVEGYFDSIKMKRLGFQVLALNWNRVTEGQAEWLKRFKEIIIFPDNDFGGKILLEESFCLTTYSDVYYTCMSEKKDKKDPDDLTIRETIFYLKNKKHISEYAIKLLKGK